MGIAEKLRGWCTDWNGAAMVRGEPPRDGIHCDDLLDAIAEIERLQAAKRRALNIADVRSHLSVKLRAALTEIAENSHDVEACICARNALRGEDQ